MCRSYHNPGVRPRESTFFGQDLPRNPFLDPSCTLPGPLPGRNPLSYTPPRPLPRQEAPPSCQITPLPMTLLVPQRRRFPNVCLSLHLGLDGSRHRPRRYTWLLPSGRADVPRHRHPNQLRRDLAAEHNHWPGTHHQVNHPRHGPPCPLAPHCGDGAPEARHHRLPRAA